MYKFLRNIEQLGGGVGPKRAYGQMIFRSESIQAHLNEGYYLQQKDPRLSWNYAQQAWGSLIGSRI